MPSTNNQRLMICLMNLYKVFLWCRLYYTMKGLPRQYHRSSHLLRTLGFRPVSVENNLNNIYNQLNRRISKSIPDAEIDMFIQNIMDLSLFAGREKSCLHVSFPVISTIVKDIVKSTVELEDAQNTFMMRLKHQVVSAATTAREIPYPFLYGFWSNPRFSTSILIQEFGSDSSIFKIRIKSGVLQQHIDNTNRLGPLDGRKLVFIDQTHMTNEQLRDIIMNLFMLYAQYLFLCKSGRHPVPVLIRVHSTTKRIYDEILELLKHLGHPILCPTDFFTEAGKKKRAASKRSALRSSSMDTAKTIYDARGGYDLNNPIDFNCFINEIIIPVMLSKLDSIIPPTIIQDQEQDPEQTTHYRQWIGVWKSLLQQFHNKGDTNLLFKDWTKENLDTFLFKNTEYEIDTSPFDAIFKGFTCVQHPSFRFPSKQEMFVYGIEPRDVEYITRYLGKGALPPPSKPGYSTQFFDQLCA